MESLRLLLPSVKWEAEYLDFARECETDTDLQASGFGFADPSKHPDFASFVQRLTNDGEGINLLPGRVPQNTFWVFAGSRMVGICKLRHTLNNELVRKGGHIGYMVRMTERGKGYGTQILALTLKKARALGLNRVLITCNQTNTGSARVIINNGGVLAEQLDPGTSRYWIELVN